MSDINDMKNAVKFMADAHQRYSDILARELNPIKMDKLPALICALEGMAEDLRKLNPEAGEVADVLKGISTRSVRKINLSRLSKEEADKFMEEFRNELC